MKKCYSSWSLHLFISEEFSQHAEILRLGWLLKYKRLINNAWRQVWSKSFYSVSSLDVPKTRLISKSLLRGRKTSASERKKKKKVIYANVCMRRHTGFSHPPLGSSTKTSWMPQQSHVFRWQAGQCSLFGMAEPQCRCLTREKGEASTEDDSALDVTLNHSLEEGTTETCPPLSVLKLHG